MHAFNAESKIAKYEKAEDICAEHFTVRLDAYVRRKEALERKYGFEEAIAAAKSEFIRAIVAGDLNLMKKSGGTLPMSELSEVLLSRGFVPYGILKSRFLGSSSTSEEDESGDFSYLISLPLQTLTTERAKALSDSAAVAKARLEAIRQHTPRSLWKEDIEALKSRLMESKRER